MSKRTRWAHMVAERETCVIGEVLAGNLTPRAALRATAVPSDRKTDPTAMAALLSFGDGVDRPDQARRVWDSGLRERELDAIETFCARSPLCTTSVRRPCSPCYEARENCECQSGCDCPGGRGAMTRQKENPE